MKLHARATMAAKLRLVFSQRRATRLKRLSFSEALLNAGAAPVKRFGKKTGRSFALDLKGWPARWLSFAQTGEHFNKAGTEALSARTRNAKSILVIGSREEFSRAGNAEEASLMRDTFELFRRESRSIDIVTFDELLERARFHYPELAG